MSIATKTGDEGKTALMYNRRVSKTDDRVEACGAIDELNSALGLARASVGIPFVTGHIHAIQKELITLMGELAVSEEDRERYRQDKFHFVTKEMVDRLTGIVDDLEKNHRVTCKGWALPGDNVGSAALDIARTTCRRAERQTVRLHETKRLNNPEILRYLNRLSDLCWLFARYVEGQAGDADSSLPSSGR